MTLISNIIFSFIVVIGVILENIKGFYLDLIFFILEIKIIYNLWKKYS